MSAGAQLRLLIELTARKLPLLAQICNICENQDMLFRQPPGEERAAFLAQIGAEKQKLIEQVIQNDDAFASAFARVKDELGGGGHAEGVSKLQVLVRDAAEWDVKIRAREEATRLFVESLSPRKNKAAVSETAAQVAGKYQRFGKGSNT